MRTVIGGRKWPVARVARDVAVVVFIALAVARELGWFWPTGHDAHAYWLAARSADPYQGAPGQTDAFLYSPAFMQLLVPLAALPFQPFLGAWTALMAGALLLIAGPFALPALLFWPVTLELVVANVNLLIGAAIVLGFRWPQAWAFVLLTKVTPGIGLVWFAVRREWRNLAIALGTTAAISAISIAIAPALWAEWFGVLAGAGTGANAEGALISLPVVVRLPAAAIVVGWGAWRGYRWTVPIGATLALPFVWESSLSLLVAALPLALKRDRDLAGDASIVLDEREVGLD